MSKPEDKTAAELRAEKRKAAKAKAVKEWKRSDKDDSRHGRPYHGWSN